jgi:hypothetical protein
MEKTPLLTFEDYTVEIHVVSGDQVVLLIQKGEIVAHRQIMGADAFISLLMRDAPDR